jgi:hypothetical protein
MKYSELSPEAQKKAHEKYEPEFFDEYVIEDAKEQGKLRGFEIDKIHYSGFWSQGDGASWQGTIDLKKFLEWEEQQEKPLLNDFQRVLLSAGAKYVSSISLTCRGRYSHSRTMLLASSVNEIAIGAELPDGPYAGMRGEDYEELLNEHVDEIDEIILSAARDYADEIYKDLEAAYEYECSEENYKELAEINEWEFDEEGEMV